MLDLKARVHLQEEELPAGVKKLHRARPGVVDRPGRPHRGLAHPPPLARFEERGGRLFDQLLVPPLNRALALEEVQRVAVQVAEDLDLDVAGPLQEALHVHACRLRKRISASRAAASKALPASSVAANYVRMPFPPPPAAALNTTGSPTAPAVRSASSGDSKGHLRTGNHGHPGRGHPPTRLHLVAHGPNRGRRRPHENQSRLHHGLREAGVLGQETIPGMDGLRSRAPGHAQQLVDGQIAPGRPGGADRVRLVGVQDVRRVAVGLGEDRDGADPQFSRPPDHPQRDLSPVGNEYALDQRTCADSPRWGRRELVERVVGLPT